jgi:hypothetical protein
MLNINKWDEGKALFAKLQNNDFFQWDIRDQFSVSCVEKILAELSTLEPTKFIAVSYVSLLLEKALQRSKVSLSKAILSSEFTIFAEELRQSKAELDDYAKPRLDNFIENIQESMEQLCESRIRFRGETGHDEDRNNQIYREEIPLLARDAVISTQIPLHWIYTTDQGQSIGLKYKVLHSEILLFSSLHELELSIHAHELAYGFRYVTVNTGDSSLHAIVFTSPEAAFIMAKLHWNSHTSKMDGEQAAYTHQLDGLADIRRHFPKLDIKNKLTMVKSGYQEIGSIKTCHDSSKIWLLMLMELMSVKLEQLCPESPKISIELLTPESSNKLLPVKINTPFTLEHKDIATVARDIGVEQSPLKSELWAIIDTLTLDDLLPRDGRLYFNVRTGERIKELDLNHKYSAEFHNVFVKLYPYPAKHFGTKESTADAVNYVLERNLPVIINAKLEDLWTLDFENQNEWFASMIKKRKAHITKNVTSWHEKEREKTKNTINYTQYIFTGIHEECRRLAIKGNTQQDRMNAVAIGIPALYKTNRKKEVLGIVTGDEYQDGCDYFVIAPNSADEIMEVFKCSEEDLPTLFKGWQRWSGHGKINYPWRRARGYALKIAAFKVYY